jgi:type II secretory pathway pseudopilin PulG
MTVNRPNHSSLISHILFRDCHPFVRTQKPYEVHGLLKLTKHKNKIHQYIKEIHIMKLTNTLGMKQKSGMTLLELTVVILVLLSLISILFIGARAWKKGSDRAANILNVRNCQQAMRGNQNAKDIAIGAAIVNADIFGVAAVAGPGGAPAVAGFLKQPVPPAAITPTVAAYTFGGNYPATGTLWVTNSVLGGADGEWFYSAAESLVKTAEW